MDCKRCLLFTLVGLSSVITLASAVNNRPIIGVLSQVRSDHFKQFGEAWLAAAYVKLLESAGARVVPILVDQPDEYYQKMFNSLNGVVLPGGGQPDIMNSSYGKAGRLFYEMSIKSFDENEDYFLVWGECLGIQLLTMITAEEDLLTDTDGDPVSLALSFEKDFRKSKLYSAAPESIINTLKTKVNLNHHKHSLTPTNFSKNAALTGFYQVLTTSSDISGIEFISSLEAYKYPIYGLAFHPEKNCFEWTFDCIDHSEDVIKVTQYFANFIVSEARKSNHAFSSEAEANSFLIYQYTPVYTGNLTIFEQIYFFNP
ncbi:gamma-glutamyl hydrolase-like [Asterias rubens]|uniref:gamma-glutamyl hydrolase-like n=1 Tax=Asterias rubens TaxID=7604 RepID=UPI0014552B20|nr:gamma-glutamyl hydrolase-like [Asterias rubens]